VRVLDGLRRDHEPKAWELMVHLLPEANAIGSYSNAPSFRGWKPEKEGVTNREFWDFSTQVAQRLIDAAGTSADRWVELVQRLGDFPPLERELAPRRVAELGASDGLSKPARQRLWTTVDTLVRRHRAFADAAWALAEDELARLATIADALAPEDPVEANRWLFDEHLPDLGSARLGYEMQSAEVEAARAEAVKQILDSGLDPLLDLVRSVKYPGLVGFSAATHAYAEPDAAAVGLLDDKEVGLVAFGPPPLRRTLKRLSRKPTRGRCSSRCWCWKPEGFSTRR
jgi:hypothetical protein